MLRVLVRKVGGIARISGDKKAEFLASEMSQWVKAFHTKSDDMSSIPDSYKLSSDVHIHIKCNIFFLKK